MLWERDAFAKRYGRIRAARSSNTTWLSSITLFGPDNGRVLGYDNNHGEHHRHFAGAEEKFAFISYEGLLERFLDEVRELRQKKEPI